MLGQYPKTHLVLILVAHRLAECRISIESMSHDKIELNLFSVTIELRLSLLDSYIFFLPFHAEGADFS